MDDKSAPPELKMSRPAPDTLLLRFAGDWKIGEKLPPIEDLQKELESGDPLGRIQSDTGELKAWDTAFLTYLTKAARLCKEKGIEAEHQGLPEGIRRLLDLASAVPERKGARREAKRINLLARMGDSAIGFWDATIEMVEFVGEATVAFLRLITGKAQYRRSDLMVIIEDTGPKALAIVSLISLLVGLILAFVGAVQLALFGAQIFVADLVGIGMVRVLGAVMAGIIMAGRTGASFAAQLGTMQVNEEIDALRTMGIAPMEFLVLPRMLALAVMMPLLCAYADLMGVLGGLIVGVGMLDLNPTEYILRTKDAVSMTTFFIGIFHSFVFGILVALAGCMRGIQCGRSATAVGLATTSAVVTSIVSIIVATAIITVLCDVIGI